MSSKSRKHVLSFGKRLRRERELRKITLEEIAGATKIGTRLLRALEEEDFGKLPGGIFNKGFVRSYARYLKIDEEQAIADYEAALGESLTPAGIDPLNALLAARARNGRLRPGQENEEAESGKIPDINAAPTRRSARTRVTVLLLAMVAGVLVFLAWNRHPVPAQDLSVQNRELSIPVDPIPAPLSEQPAETQKKATRKTPTKPPAALPAGAPETASPETAPVDTGSLEVPEASPAASESATSFQLQIQAVQESWVSITADGQLVATETLAASTERTVRAEREVVLKVGNAAGVHLIHNGEALPPLGDTAKVRTVTVTSEGIQQ